MPTAFYDVSVGRTKGSLTDHYDPKRQVVNLSDTTFGNDSVAAVAVAAHEIGHVMQKEKGYIPYKIRTVLVADYQFRLPPRAAARAAGADPRPVCRLQCPKMTSGFIWRWSA